MRKSDKKREKAIVAALEKACNLLLDKEYGFKWLTHFVDYDQYPNSLKIICIFESNRDLSKLDKADVLAVIAQQLLPLEFNRSLIERCIRFDTEENCEQEHRGNWKARLQSVYF